jgi:predicted RNA binding protein YcfA (HicA-like mRNA interferase family)
MSGLHNLKPGRVVQAFIKAGWTRRKTGSGHAILTKEGNINLLSIPIHKGKPVKQGLLRNQIKLAGMTVEEFLKYYK